MQRTPNCSHRPVPFPDRLWLIIALVAICIDYVRARGQESYTPYAFSNLAGSPGGPGNVDGAGSAARFFLPAGTAVDSKGNVYVWICAIRQSEKSRPLDL